MSCAVLISVLFHECDRFAAHLSTACSFQQQKDSLQLPVCESLSRSNPRQRVNIAPLFVTALFAGFGRNGKR